MAKMAFAMVAALVGSVTVAHAAAPAAAGAAAAAPAAAAAAGAPKRIELAVGGQRLLSAERVANYSIAVGDVVSVKLSGDGRYLVLLGAKVGFSGLTLIGNDGAITSYDIHVGAEPSASSDATRIDLSVGGQKILPIAGVTSFATGSDVVQVKTFEDGRRLLLNAVKPGYTSLTLLYADGRVESFDIRVGATHRD